MIAWKEAPGDTRTSSQELCMGLQEAHEHNVTMHCQSDLLLLSRITVGPEQGEPPHHPLQNILNRVTVLRFRQG
ncbi:hypothetical protein RB195_019693 [Necator americanus]|uniref:Uncharacterized protein n=1 Tax=Necator americanus TaxID=51031 RepID=A0ABR1CFB9_NECAM